MEDKEKKVLCFLLDNKFRWLARDKYGDIYAFISYPSKSFKEWFDDAGNTCLCLNYLDDGIFDDITWDEDGNVISILHRLTKKMGINLK